MPNGDWGHKKEVIKELLFVQHPVMRRSGGPVFDVIDIVHSGMKIAPMVAFRVSFHFCFSLVCVFGLATLRGV
jgi:hypothetical protein